MMSVRYQGPRQVSSIQQIVADVIICPRHWYLILVQHASHSCLWNRDLVFGLQARWALLLLWLPPANYWKMILKTWWMHMYYCKGMILWVSHCHVLYNSLETTFTMTTTTTTTTNTNTTTTTTTTTGLYPRHLSLIRVDSFICPFFWNICHMPYQE